MPRDRERNRPYCSVNITLWCGLPEWLVASEEGVRGYKIVLYFLLRSKCIALDFIPELIRRDKGIDTSSAGVLDGKAILDKSWQSPTFVCGRDPILSM